MDGGSHLEGNLGATSDALISMNKTHDYGLRPAGLEGAPQFLTEKQVANMLQVSVSMLRKWRGLDEGPKYRKIGRLVRYDLQEVLRFVKGSF